MFCPRTKEEEACINVSKYKTTDYVWRLAKHLAAYHTDRAPTDT